MRGVNARSSKIWIHLVCVFCLCGMRRMQVKVLFSHYADAKTNAFTCYSLFRSNRRNNSFISDESYLLLWWFRLVCIMICF